MTVLSYDRDIIPFLATTPTACHLVFPNTLRRPSYNLQSLGFEVLDMPEGVSLFKADYTLFSCHPNIVLLFEHLLQLFFQPVVSLHNTPESLYFCDECNILELPDRPVDLTGVLVMPFEHRETPTVVVGVVLFSVVVWSGMQG